VRVDVDDPFVDGRHPPADLRLTAGGGDEQPGGIDLFAQRERRRVDRQLLLPEFLAEPPQLVVGLGEVRERLARAGEVVELPPLHALPDLSLDP
jgi:hypothetical protein